MAARAGGPHWTARSDCRAAPRGPPQSSAWRCRPRPRAPPPPAPRPLPASRPPPRTRTGRARAWGGGCCGGLRAPGLGGGSLRGKGARCRPSGVCPLAGHEAGAAYDDIRRPVRSDGPRVGLAGQGGISGGGPPRPGAGPAGGRGWEGGGGRDGLARAKRGGRPGVQCRRGGGGAPAGGPAPLPSLPPHCALGGHGPNRRWRGGRPRIAMNHGQGREF